MKKERKTRKRVTVQRARKRARYYHEQSRTNSSYLLLPGLPLNLPSPLLAGRLPTILYVVHFREADRSLAGRAFRLHDLAVHLCKMERRIRYVLFVTSYFFANQKSLFTCAQQFYNENWRGRESSFKQKNSKFYSLRNGKLNQIDISVSLHPFITTLHLPRQIFFNLI